MMEQNSFNKYGFETPAFEGEILKELSDNLWVAYALIDNTYIPFTVDKTGFISGGQFSNDFKLLPIKKPWYEDESNFPCLVVGLGLSEEYKGYITIALEYCEEKDGNYLATIDENYPTTKDVRLATREEVLSLFVKD